MKRRTYKLYGGILIVLLVIIIITPGMGSCFGPHGAPPDYYMFQPLGPPPPPPIGPPLPLGIHLLLAAQEEKILSEITGKSLEEIRQQLSCLSLPLYLDANGIPPETFRKAMDEQFIKLIGQAGAAGIITKQQSDEIQTKLKAESKSCTCHHDFENCLKLNR